MKRIKIEVVKIEEDKYYVAVETLGWGFSQTVCNKKEMQEILLNLPEVK